MGNSRKVDVLSTLLRSLTNVTAGEIGDRLLEQSSGDMAIVAWHLNGYSPF